MLTSQYTVLRLDVHIREGVDGLNKVLRLVLLVSVIGLIRWLLVLFMQLGRCLFSFVHCLLDHHLRCLVALGLKWNLSWNITSLWTRLEPEVLQVHSQLAASRLSTRVVEILPRHLLLMLLLHLA